jgi:hypothetical protein
MINHSSTHKSSPNRLQSFQAAGLYALGLHVLASLAGDGPSSHSLPATPARASPDPCSSTPLLSDAALALDSNHGRGATLTTNVQTTAEGGVREANCHQHDPNTCGQVSASEGSGSFSGTVDSDAPPFLLSHASPTVENAVQELRVQLLCNWALCELRRERGALALRLATRAIGLSLSRDSPELCSVSGVS